MFTRKTKRVARFRALRHQIDFTNNEYKHPCLVGGLGSGKTEAGVYRVVKFILKNSDTLEKTGTMYKFGIYMPNNSYFKRNIIPNLEKWLTRFGIEYKPNATDFTFKIYDKTGTQYAIIYMITLDNPAKIVSYEMHDSWTDELDILLPRKAELSFSQVNERNRAKKIKVFKDGKMVPGLNTHCVTTTPNGGKSGFIYTRWVKDIEINNLIKNIKESDKLKYIYHMTQVKTKKNVFLPLDYLRNFMTYTKNRYLMMVEAEFVDYTAYPVYTSYDRVVNDTDVIWNGEPLHIGMDFNIRNMSAVVSIIKYEDGLKKMYIIDELHTSGLTGENIVSIPEMIAEINRLYPNQGKSITIYPDASGSHGSALHETNTFVTMLEEHFTVKLNYKNDPLSPTNPSIDNRVNTVNECFLNLNMETKVYINEKECEKLVYGLIHQDYEVDERGIYKPSKKKDIDHMIDAMGYLIYYNYNIKTLHQSTTQESDFY